MIKNIYVFRSAVLTLYVCIDIRDQVYQAVYLSTCTSSELIHKMSAALGLTVPQIAAVYVRGPNNIKIIITDELVTHLPDQSAYLISILQGIVNLICFHKTFFIMKLQNYFLNSIY